MGKINSYNYSHYDDKIEELFAKLIDPDSGECSMDEEFMTEYLKTHTKEDLIDNLYTITDEMYDFYDNVDKYDAMTWDDNKKRDVFNIIKSVISLAANVAEIEIKNIDLTNENAPGFYTENADEYPKHDTFEVTEKFYGWSGEYLYDDTKTCTIEYTYYGDFAVRHNTGYRYNTGRYGWYAGTFHNELASWDPYDEYSLYYKGKHISLEEDSSHAFFSDVKSLKYISVGDHIYIIYDGIEQCYNNVWGRVQE